MAKQVVMPRISMTMIEGVVAEWHKKVGDTVVEGEPLLEVETDKITQTMNSPFSGVVLSLSAGAGDIVPVDDLLCAIGQPDELSCSEAQTPSEESKATHAKPVDTLPKVAEMPQPDGRITATPLARKIAAEKGVSLGSIAGTGMRGMVTKADVLAFVPAPVISAPVASAPVQSTEEDTVIPFTGIRRRIADNMMLTRQTMADVTTFAEVDIGNIKALRRNMKVSYTTFAVRAAALALEEFPAINAQIQGENIVLKKHVNVNVAVATPRGLITPVIRDTNKMNLLTIAERMDDLAVRGRSNKLIAEDLTDGTFTVTNSGVFGAMFFTPIINSPQCAILGMGKMFTLAMIDDAGAIVPTTLMMLSLSYDHRVVDGETSVKFLQRIKYYMENPADMLRVTKKEN